jgi:hypothetical protein
MRFKHHYRGNVFHNQQIAKHIEEAELLYGKVIYAG